jgi:hypothetical protein
METPTEMTLIKMRRRASVASLPLPAVLHGR